MCKNEEMLILLSGHLDGCNTPDEEARLDEHLAQCADCRRTLEEYSKNDAGMISLVQSPADGFTQAVMRAVNAEPRNVEPKKPRKWTFGFATAAAAVAAIFLLAIGSGMLPQLGVTSAKMNDSAMKSADAAAPAAEPEPMAAEEPLAEEAYAEAAPEAALSASAYFQAEVVEISDGAMLVKPLGGYPEADYAEKIHVVIQNMPSSPEPSVGDVIEVTYSGTMAEDNPPSPNGVVSIKVISHK